MTFAEGRDALYDLITDAWVAYAPTAPMLYADKDASAPESGLWAKAMVKFNGGSAAAIGKRLWDCRGIIVVQIFKEAGQGSMLDAAGQAMVVALRGKTVPAWITQVQMVDVGRDGKWNQANITAEFEFQQLQ